MVNLYWLELHFYAFGYDFCCRCMFFGLFGGVNVGAASALCNADDMEMQCGHGFSVCLQLHLDLLSK